MFWKHDEPVECYHLSKEQTEILTRHTDCVHAFLIVVVVVCFSGGGWDYCMIGLYTSKPR